MRDYIDLPGEERIQLKYLIDTDKEVIRDPGGHRPACRDAGGGAGRSKEKFNKE